MNPIHYVKTVTRERGQRVVTTRCGTTITQSCKDQLHDMATAWEQDVTCDGCKLPPK